MKISQPKGMIVLASTEIFERLSFATLSFLLVLYAAAPVSEQGLGWTKSQALTLSGVYAFCAYTFGVFGSYIADHYFGQNKSISIGGFIIICGHFMMYFSSNTIVLFLSLFMVSAGTGLLKPCMPALLGNLYQNQDKRREAGFSWYYCGVNFGVMLAGITSGFLLNHFGYHVALASAGVGMTFGMCIYFAGKKFLKFSDLKKITAQLEMHQTTKEEKSQQKNSIYALGIAFIFFTLWTIIYHIAFSGTIILFVENNTFRQLFDFKIPSTFFSSLGSLTILIMTPIITTFLRKKATQNKYPHFFSQLSFGLFFSTLSLFYFTFLTLNFNPLKTDGYYFMHYQIALFFVLVAASEAILSPVMMSAISVIAPKKYKSFFQSFFLVSFGITGIFAAKIGSYALKFPFEVFLTLSISMFILSILFYMIKNFLIALTGVIPEDEKEKLFSRHG